MKNRFKNVISAVPRMFANNSSVSLFILTAILLFGVFLRMRYSLGFGMGDDRDYLRVIEQFTQGQHLVRADQFHLSPLRVGYLYPIAVIFRLFGVSENNFILFNFLSGILLITGTFLIGQFLFSTTTALFAAFLIAILPLSVFASSVLFNDLPIACLQAFGVLFFLAGIKQKKFLLLFPAAIVIFWAYLMKPNGPWIAIPAVLFAFILFPKQRKTVFFYSITLAGLLITFLFCECIYYWLKTGDFFLRIHVNQRHYYTFFFGDFDVSRIRGIFLFYPHNMFRLPLAINEYGAIFFVLIPSLLLLLIWYKDKWRETVFVLGWLVILFGLLQFGSMSLSDYYPMHRLTRFLIIIFVPACLLCAEAIRRLGGKSRTRRAIVYVPFLLFMLFSSYTSLEELHRLWFRISKHDIEQVKLFIRRHRPSPIYSLHWMSGIIDLETAFGTRTEFHEFYGDIKAIPPDSYVVIGGVGAFANTDSYMDEKQHQSLLNPPKSWKPIFSSKGPKYHGRKYPLTIYKTE